MKLGILGTGMIVKDLLTTIHKFSIESIYILGTKNTEQETEQLVKQYGLNGYYLDYDELLQSDIDTVYVALPNFLHYSFAKKALLQGKHAIIEKPITCNVKELEDLKNIALQNKCIILEAMNIHYLPAYKSLKENVHLVGDVKIVNFNYSQYSSRYNAFKQGEILPAFDYHKAGGALMDINVYNIHGVVGLFGKPNSVHYFANIEKNIDTSGMLVLEYDTFKVNCIGAKDCSAKVLSTIQGNEGNIQIDIPINGISAYTFIDNKRQESITDFGFKEHRLYYEFIEFIDIIDHLNFDKANQMIEISTIAANIMQEARNKAGIVFDND